jgi:hypothetical protein
MQKKRLFYANFDKCGTVSAAIVPSKRAEKKVFCEIFTQEVNRCGDKKKS